MSHSIDDRGNVVDIYLDGDSTGRIDREADPVTNDFGYAFIGGIEEMNVAMLEGYSEDIAIAVICAFLRGEDDAMEQAENYIKALTS
jgi:hypothetical protein